MKYLVSVILFLLLISGCTKEELFSEQIRHDLWLIHEGAKLPIVVEGNTKSKVFVILLHGGPGGTSQDFNLYLKEFTDPLEDDYAMVYYDQRNSGIALGEWDEDKLTVEQYVEDLEMVISLLQHKFGGGIQLFLAGHSWGGYLGTSFLLKAENELMIKGWINIDGLIHRNMNQLHVLDRIDAIGLEQTNNSLNISDWQDILNKVEKERNKSITQYDVVTEKAIFDLLNLAEAQINRDRVLSNGNSNSSFFSIFQDNYDPFRILINGNHEKKLRTQMYEEFDLTIDADLNSITIPSLSIYGYYDVNTPLQQGEYFNNSIATQEEDKKLVILDKSGHTSMGNEPALVVNEMKLWIEKYK